MDGPTESTGRTVWQATAGAAPYLGTSTGPTTATPGRDAPALSAASAAIRGGPIGVARSRGCTTSTRQAGINRGLSFVNGATSSNIAYDQNGDLKEIAVTIYEVKDGKWTMVKTMVSQAN